MPIPRSQASGGCPRALPPVSPPPPPPPPPVLLSVQYLRALAALAVVAHHAGERVGLPLGVAAAGVDLFFVVSGVIMWTVAGGGASGGPGAFLWRRAARVVPLYWTATLGLALAALAAPSLLPNLRPDAGHVLLSLLFLPHPGPDGDGFPLLVPGWTLNFEMFFYLVFAAALALPRAVRLRALTLALVALVALGTVLPAPADGGSALATPLGTWTHPLLLQFLAGCLLGRAWEAGRLRRGVVPRALAWGLVAAGLAAYGAMGALRVYDDAWRWALWGLPAVLVAAGALALDSPREAGGGVAEWRVPRALGDASYSIYLLHAPLVAALAAPKLGVAAALGPWGFLALGLVASSALGLLCHRLVEVRLTLWVRALPGRLRRRGAAAAGMALGRSWAAWAGTSRRAPPVVGSAVGGHLRDAVPARR